VARLQIDTYRAIIELMGVSRPRIGVIGPGLSHYIFRHLLRGAAAQARQDDAALLVYSAAGHLRGTLLRTEAHGEWEMAIRFADPSMVDAVVVYAAGLVTRLSMERVGEFLAKLPKRVIAVGAQIEGVPGVTIDNAEGMRRLVSHLIEAHDARKIAYINGPPTHPEAVQRLAGVRMAMEDAGLHLADRFVVPGEFFSMSGTEGVATLLDERGVTPDAIACANDATASGVITELARRGIRVPDDILVVGFDDSPYAVATDPQLTTVRQAFDFQGAEAVRMALELLRTGSTEPVSVSPVPVFRKSCGCDAWVIEQQPDEILQSRPEYKKLVAAIKAAITRHEVTILRVTLPRILGNVPERGGHLLSLALQEARRRLGESISAEEVELLSASAAVVAAQYEAGVQRRLRSQQDDLALMELLFARTLDQVVDADQFEQESRLVFDFIGVKQYELVRILDENTGVILADSLSSDVHGSMIPLDKFSETIRRVAERAGPETISAVVPMPFLADILGFGVLNIEPEKAQAVDTVAFGIGGLFHRLRLIEELDRLEELRRQSYEHQVATQHQLIESERLASLGRLVSGIAHEMNTPLGVTTTALSHLYAQTSRIAGALRPDVPEADEWLSDSREALRIIERGINRMSDLVARFQSIEPARESNEGIEIDAQEAIHAVVNSMAPELESRCVIAEVSVPLSVRFRMPIDVISRVFFALIQNSTEHAFENRQAGTISISVRPENGGARIDYSDDGVGVDADNLDRIFEPFFTTRRVKGHVGLGLHAVHNLVTGTIGGTIVAECPAGSGLSISIWIPESAIVIDDQD
jgi:DNA-binding LacI/PurR family transcriptional regulator/signal transduction histidine kinase